MESTRMTRGQRLLHFLYSTPNIVGSLLGLFGLLLFFTGIIGAYWFLIVAGLYLIGVIGTPNDPRFDLQFKQRLTAEQIRGELNGLLRAIRKRVPKEIYEKVESIRESIFTILPYIEDVNAADPYVHSIRRTALDYLPTALENYINLPPAYANFHPIRNGKTARQILGDQLTLLDREMEEIVVDIGRSDTQKLLAHGRFLQDKFGADDLLPASR